MKKTFVQRFDSNPGYTRSNLQKEIVLSVSGSCLGLMSGGEASLHTCRSWIINPAISVPLALTTLIVGILQLDISSLIGMLKLNLSIMFIEFLMFFVYALININKTDQGFTL